MLQLPHLNTLAVIYAVICTSSTFAGCQQPLTEECERSEQCPAGQMCRLADCVSSTRGVAKSDAAVGGDVSETAAKGDDSKPVRCKSGRPPGAGELAINEVLADVPSGPAGDASGDGERDPYGDEFIELVNRSGTTLDLHDVVVSVDGDEKHGFAGRCLPPGHGMVLFGGVPMADSNDDVQVVGIDGLGLSNSGGRIEIQNPADHVIDEFEWSGGRSESLTLSPQIHGASYGWHSAMSPDNALFSPGLCASGEPITEC